MISCTSGCGIPAASGTARMGPLVQTIPADDAGPGAWCGRSAGRGSHQRLVGRVAFPVVALRFIPRGFLGGGLRGRFGFVAEHGTASLEGPAEGDLVGVLDVAADGQPRAG